MHDLPDYVRLNQASWDDMAADWVAYGERAWAGEPMWGNWGRPESEVSMLVDDMSGMQAIEFGCGTGYVSGWMARRGADPIGVDISRRQLATARRLAREHDVRLPLVQCNAERIPVPDESFDYGISEYGASIWADPYVWLPEAWRVLRSGAHLTFLGNHPLALCVQARDQDAPATRTLSEPYFNLHRVDWRTPTETLTSFCLPVSEWMRLFSQVGFEILDYVEIRAPHPDPDDVRGFIDAAWAHDYPSEHAWRLRRI